MIGVCGSDAILNLIGELPAPEGGDVDIEMHGPAIADEGISQDEIDALFD